MSKSDQWQTTCPVCRVKGSLVVISAVLAATGEMIEPNSRLDPDGFGIDPSLNPDGKDFSTEDEEVRCSSCGRKFDLSDLEIEPETGKPYTVVGYHADNDQPFVDHRKASDPQEAARKSMLYRKGSCAVVVDVFEGSLQGVLKNEKVLTEEG